MKAAVKKDLQIIPGVGPKTAEDLWNLGIRSIKDLQREEPEELYRRLCLLQNQPVDRCMLYVFRCAIYYATHDQHEPELLKWWNWTDGRIDK